MSNKNPTTNDIEHNGYSLHIYALTFTSDASLVCHRYIPKPNRQAILLPSYGELTCDKTWLS